MGESLEGLSVVVTGASRGIGLATAEALVARGAWVGMVARSEGPLREAAKRCGGHPLPADVSSASSVEKLAGAVESVGGGAPDVIVNSAGAFSLSAFVDTSPETLDAQLTTNVRGPFLVTRAFLPQMIARGSGHLVNVGSVAGRLPLPGNAAYGTSKFGLRGLHEILTTELQGTGVRATFIEPAATDTSLWDPLDPDSRDDLPSRSAMLRPQDVARAIVFAIAQPPGVEVGLLALRSIR
ncbi:MAG: SDR family NAD(P)-dependent oxidoreductase [Gemmatimonas sp.]|nr:SDR family NAD(P)-dependent oxidoreductase [Gemmatimonas sp.]